MDAAAEDMTQFMLAFTGESSPVDDVPFTLPAADTETALAAWDKERAA